MSSAEVGRDLKITNTVYIILLVLYLDKILIQRLTSDCSVLQAKEPAIFLAVLFFLLLYYYYAFQQSCVTCEVRLIRVSVLAASHDTAII